MLCTAFAVSAAESNRVTGTVTGVSADRSTITVQNDATGERRTYFVEASTQITGASGGRSMLRGLKRGDVVNLSYRNADTGREVGELSVVRQNEEVPAPSFVGSRVVSGEITGKRTPARSITIREDRSSTRRTIFVPETVKITKEGQSIDFARLRRGDFVEFRYRMTDTGPVISVEEEIVVVETQPVEAEPVALPKTATNNYAWLFAGLLFLLAGFAVTRLRAQ